MSGSQLPQRALGPFAVSAIGLGCMNLSHAYGNQRTVAGVRYNAAAQADIDTEEF